MYLGTFIEYPKNGQKSIWQEPPVDKLNLALKVKKCIMQVLLKKNYKKEEY